MKEIGRKLRFFDYFTEKFIWTDYACVLGRINLIIDIRGKKYILFYFFV